MIKDCFILIIILIPRKKLIILSFLGNFVFHQVTEFFFTVDSVPSKSMKVYLILYLEHL